MLSNRFLIKILKKAMIMYFIELSFLIGQSNLNVLSSSKSELVLEISTTAKSKNDLKSFDLLIGLPNSFLPKFEIISSNETNHTFNLPANANQIKWINNQKVNGMNTGTLRISPLGQSQNYFQKLIIKIPFFAEKNNKASLNKAHFELLRPKIVNWSIAKDWIERSENKIAKKSSLPDGTWINFTIESDGVYRIEGETINSLLQNSFSFDPRSIMLFSGSAFGRDETYNDSQTSPSLVEVPANLIEIPMTILGESDGNLSNKDYLFFYVRGPSGFNIVLDKIKWHQNLYFNKSIYWILIPNNNTLRGQRIDTGNLINSGPFEVDYGLVFNHYEIDKINPEESGLSWGNKVLSNGASIIENVQILNPMLEANVNGSIGMIGNEKINTRFKNTNHSIALYGNNIKIADIDWTNTGPKSKDFTINAGTINEGENTFKITNQSLNSNSEPLFDYINFSYQKKLIYEKPFDFVSSLQSTDLTYKIYGSDIIIWDISDKLTPINQPILSTDAVYMKTTIPKDTLKRFYVFKTDDITKISELEIIENKKWDNVRSLKNEASHIVIGPEVFRSASSSLINHRKESMYFSLNDIYSEFSGGNKDPIAIKYFLMWAKVNWKISPTSVLFMGDADYDYRNISGNSKIIVPTIQIGKLNSYATDDRFVAFNGKIPEMATGRFPARTINEVTDFCEKIIEFEKNMKKGIWKQRIALVADDPARPEKESFELSTGKSHTINSEKIARIIPDFMEKEKIYLVNFNEVNNSTILGTTKPAATQKLIETINSGTSIINYIGHGNSTQWAQEKLLIINENRNDIDLINTEMKLPLWIAGTCNWGHFDKIDEESFAEELIRVPMDGASAVISTSRGISVTSNIMFLERIFNEIFKDESVSGLTVGSLLQSVKTGGSDGALFHLFGDPAMKLPLPKKIIKNAYVVPDTLSSLEVGSLNAQMDNPSGSGNFVLQDAEETVSVNFYFGSEKESITYLKNGAKLSKGSFTYSNNTISPKFRVPKDISFADGNANVKFNINGDDGSEAAGSASNITFIPGLPSADVNGPIIAFLTESGRALRDNDYIKRGEKIKVKISDPSGINITQRKGHEMVLYDEVISKNYYISDKFEYDINSINSGVYIFKPDFGFDEVNINIKAWDNANNPSEAQIKLDITESDIFELKNVYNFPNPFYDKTQFTFEITQSAEISIDIYTLSGLKVNSIFPKYFEEGYGIIDWDGTDQFGQILSNGVYLFQMKAKNNLKKINFTGRIAILR